MPFQHGNQAAKNADHRRSRLITQQLTSALNEPAGEGDVTKLRKLVDKLIARATEGEGDITAIKEIIDRVDGKSPQAIAGPDGEGPLARIDHSHRARHSSSARRKRS